MPIGLSSRRAGARAGAWLLACCAAAASAHEPGRPHVPGIDERIAYYERDVAEHPERYPAFARLGGAYLDKARAEADPHLLEKARAALERSAAIQPNFEAFSLMAAACNYGHRFEEALRWARRAAAAWPEHTGTVAQRVEALLALGQLDAARQLLPDPARAAEDFHLAAALAHCRLAEGRFDEAAGSFLQAAERARAAGVPARAAWALVSAAGAHLDAGAPAAAHPLLDQAARLAPDDPFLLLHRSELQEAEGHPEDALATLDAALARHEDGVLHARASRLAARLGRTEDARRHFAAAERAFLRAEAAGEVYTLEALARLYAEAHVHPGRARDLARRNLQYKRDADARATLDLALRPPE